MTGNSEHRFQVHLDGMIDILSNHLYSSPKVFIRELLQNATDAITAIVQNDPAFSGKIFVEIIPHAGHGGTLMVEDNGVGLTEQQIHEFLSIIGQSSKGDRDLLQSETSFIGRFGIGLLACFIVSDEIIFITTSSSEKRSYEWKGKRDGTYTIREVNTNGQSGTKVYLRCKAGKENFFRFHRMDELLTEYGGFLPYPITLLEGGLQKSINVEYPSWLEQPELLATRKEDILRLGETLLGGTFLDTIPLRTSTGGTIGIAYVLPYAVNLNATKTHRVYLKRILVSERTENILPDWAFFVKCILWTEELQPTASRESFYVNHKLEEVRIELGQVIRNALIHMAEHDSGRLERILDVHHLSIKALAVQDDAFFRIIYQWLPFESTMGVLSLGHLISANQTIRYTRTVEEFRQLSTIAIAQSLFIINGGYVYNTQILEKLTSVVNGLTVIRIESSDISLMFKDVDDRDYAHAQELASRAEAILQQFRCKVQIKCFMPQELSTLILASNEYHEQRLMERTRDISKDIFTNILGSFTQKNPVYATLCLNASNPLVQKLLKSGKSEHSHITIEILYINALLMGHHPLCKNEMQLLNEGIIRLIDGGLNKLF